MRRTALLVLFNLLLCILAPSAFAATSATKPPQIPVREFFKNPERCCYALSPSGTKIAFMKPWETRLNIYIRPVDGGQEKQITSVKDRDLSHVFWKSDRYLIFMRDFGGDENFHVFAHDLETGKEVDLTPHPNTRASVVDDLEDGPSDEMIISHNRRDPKVFDVFRINVRTGKEKKIAENNGKIMGWLTDHAGRLRVAIESDGVNTRVLYRETEGAAFRLLKETSFKDEFSPLMFTFDNKRLYVESNLGRDKTSLVEFDPAKAQELRVIYQHTDNDIGRLLASRKRKLLTGITVNTWKNNLVFFDLQTEKLYRSLEARFPGEEVRIFSSNKNEDRHIVVTFSDKSSGKYYFHDEKTGRTELLVDLSAHLPPENLTDIRPIQYTSRDGLVIHGYLALPKGREAKNLPVVVNPHGGPWARNNWGYNPEMQFLANRGYAVLQMNFRGSTGYGRRFWMASFKEWGKTMQNDVTDGVDWLIRQGIANPKKVCIYGGSYGGYATLAGLAFTPKVYACGVDYVGVSNIFTLLETIPPYWEPMRQQLYEMIGHPEKDKDLLTAASPIFHVDKIRAPLLVAQGAKDPRVKQAESDQIVAALKKRGIDVPYILKENEGHGFHNEENRFEFYEAMDKFLGKHLN